MLYVMSPSRSRAGFLSVHKMKGSRLATKRLFLLTLGLLSVLALGGTTLDGRLGSHVPRAVAQTAGGCSLSQPAFCDTFDAPAGTGNRSGQLNGTVWGVSRTTGHTNFSTPADG